jgi:hypothetical protein
MKPKGTLYRNIVATYITMVGIALMGLGIRVAHADSLYIGDARDNTVKSFDASTGAYRGIFVTKDGCPANPKSSPLPGCLYGPTGLIFDGQSHLLVANQNVTLGFPGAIYEYSATAGAFVKALVPYTAMTPPPAPRGIVLESNPVRGLFIIGNREQPRRTSSLQWNHWSICRHAGSPGGACRGVSSPWRRYWA